MHKAAEILAVSALMLCSIGCRDDRPTQISLTQVVASWAANDVALPSQEEVARFREGLPESLNALDNGLRDADPNVRRSSASVLASLAESATPLARQLCDSFDREDVALNRIYVAMALASINDRAPEHGEFLRNRFDAEQEGATRTYLAGALVRAAGSEAAPHAWRWIGSRLDIDDGPGRDELARFQSDGKTFPQQLWAGVFVAARLGSLACELTPQLRAIAASEGVPYQIRKSADQALTTMSCLEQERR